MVTGAAPTALARGLRLAVAVLAVLLPSGFRDRQRAEWTADLMTLPTGRWRYLFGAARTLPALRAAARRAGLSRGPAAAVRASLALAAPARILLAGLGWPVLSWLLVVPLPYFVFDIPDRIARTGVVDPKSLWPGGVLFWVLLPLMLALTFGAYVALAGGWLLAATVGLAGAAVGAACRRIWLAVAGLALATLALLAITVVGLPMYDPGYGAALLGTVAVGLGLWGRSLGRWQRGWLVVVGLAAAAVLVAHHTTLGAAMHAWYLD